MVEITTEEINQAMVIEMESQIKLTRESQERRIEAFEELKNRVRPKMVVVKRELADVVKIFKDFHDEYEEQGRPVFVKTLNYYEKLFEFDV